MKIWVCVNDNQFDSVVLTRSGVKKALGIKATRLLLGPIDYHTALDILSVIGPDRIVMAQPHIIVYSDYTYDVDVGITKAKFIAKTNSDSKIFIHRVTR